MSRLCFAVLSLLALAGASAALADPPAACPQAALLAPAPPAISTPAPKPRFLSQFPGCAAGYAMADEQCVPCGWDSYQGCVTCVNLWTNDEYSTCGSCSTAVCTPP
jgi:hypothetical protein